MNKRFTIALLAAFASIAVAAPEIPPAAQRKVDFEKDVAPIFATSCMQCHANGKYEADLSIESREKLLEGGASSPAIDVGKSSESLLIQLVSGTDPDRIMPQKGKRLTPEQIGVLRAWIDQGAEWPKGYVLHDANKPIPAKVEPRKVELPPASADVTNPIDRILSPYFEKHNAKSGELVDDRVFARRVYLDLTGMLPPSGELEEFVNDTGPQKRSSLVKKLLADDDRYATHWLAFWNDLLRNDYKGTGYIDGGRLQITRWLYESLKNNMPYDEFVRQLVVGSKGAEGFTKGIVWRGVVNSAQTPQMQAAQNIGQVFMGVNLKCASCHDSFISQWKLTDSYGLAGVYADKPLEMERCTKPLGKTAKFKFLYPQLGEIDQKAPTTQRVRQLAKIITSETNGRLSRTIVNRIWQRMMGRGIIEPVDEMDNPPWNADLLDALAWDFAHDQKYDIRKVIETIALSRAYQMPCAPAGDEHQKDFVFRGPGVKRMSAEQYVDAVSSLCNVWAGQLQAKLTDTMVRFGQSRWIWTDKESRVSAPAGTLYFRREIEIDKEFTAVPAIVTADNEFTLYLNGKEVAHGEEWGKPTVVDLKPHLVKGKNVFGVKAVNTTTQPSPAGFWMQANGKLAKPAKKRDEFVFNSDTNWKYATTQPAKGWLTVGFDDSNWNKPKVEGDISAEPWKLQTLLPDDNPLDHPNEIRAALCAADPLTTALGRPNRDQVNTVRPSAATTLMALELTNGATLYDVLKKGAAKMATEKDINSEDLINRVYLKALSRSPSPSELAAGKEIVGANVSPEGVEDFLWAVTMLPEFQLIR